MRLKRRGGTKRDRQFGDSAESFSGHGDFCVGDFPSVWVSRPTSTGGADEVYFVVVVFVSGDRDRHWVGDVSLLAVSVRRVNENGPAC